MGNTTLALRRKPRRPRRRVTLPQPPHLSRRQPQPLRRLHLLQPPLRHRLDDRYPFRLSHAELGSLIHTIPFCRFSKADIQELLEPDI